MRISRYLSKNTFNALKISWRVTEEHCFVIDCCGLSFGSGAFVVVAAAAVEPALAEPGCRRVGCSTRVPVGRELKRSARQSLVVAPSSCDRFSCTPSICWLYWFGRLSAFAVAGFWTVRCPQWPSARKTWCRRRCCRFLVRGTRWLAARGTPPSTIRARWGSGASCRERRRFACSNCSRSTILPILAGSRESPCSDCAAQWDESWSHTPRTSKWISRAPSMESESSTSASVRRSSAKYYRRCSPRSCKRCSSCRTWKASPRSVSGTNQTRPSLDRQRGRCRWRTETSSRPTEDSCWRDSGESRLSANGVWRRIRDSWEAAVVELGHRSDPVDLWIRLQKKNLNFYQEKLSLSCNSPNPLRPGAPTKPFSPLKPWAPWNPVNPCRPW